MKKGLTILLVDDEVYAIHLMEALLRNRNGITTIFTATNRKDALELVVAQQPDIVFQDIKMMDTDGLELVDEYRKLHYEGEIVFVTAYEQYAIAAIRKAAFDYLLKPVDMDELDAVLLRLRAKMSEKKHEKPMVTGKLKIPTRSGFLLLALEEIVYCEADGNYTNIMFTSGQLHITSINLGAIQEMLPRDKFFRLSRSVIVNTAMISELNKGKLCCLLKINGNEYSFHITPARAKLLEELL